MRNPIMIGRRHLLTKVVPGISAAVLLGVETAKADQRIILNGVPGRFYRDGEAPQQPQPAAAEDSPGVDILTQRYEDLTAAEMISMTVGIPLQAKEPHQASRIMQLSLDLEHFLSVIPLDPTKVTKESADEIRKLRDQLTVLSGIKVLLHLFNEIPGDIPVKSGPLKRVRGS